MGIWGTTLVSCIGITHYSVIFHNGSLAFSNWPDLATQQDKSPNTQSAKQWHLFTPNVLSNTECYRLPSLEVGGGDLIHLFIGTEETELVGHVCSTL